MATARPRKAWLVRWDWEGERTAVNQPVAAILRPRMSPSRVLEIVEILYAASQYTPDEMLALAQPDAFKPYPARYGQLDEVTWTGEIYCGANPWLYARHARVWPTNDGSGGVEWEYDARPRSPL